MINIVIDDEFVQSVGEAVLDDEHTIEGLTEDELADIDADIQENLYEFVYERVTDILEYREMIYRNKDAEKSLPHFAAYHRNHNAFQHEFYKVAVFATEKDAKSFAGRHATTEDDEWKIMLVDQEGERQVYGLNLA